MLSVSTAALRRILWLDASTGVAMAISHLAFADLIAGWTGMPHRWLLGMAAAVAGFVLLAGWLASRVKPPSAGLRALVAINLGWVAMSLWMVLASGLPLTALGVGWVLLQACFVLILAILEWAGIRSLGSDQRGPTVPTSGRASPSAPVHHPREAARS